MEASEIPTSRSQAGGLRIMSSLDAETEAIVNNIIGAAIEVHRDLGPGHPESIYEEALCFEFTARCIPFLCQHPIRVEYKGHIVGTGKVDLLVADRIVIEIKAVEMLARVHEAQLAAYLKATKLKIGLLINFNVDLLKKGLKRLVN